MDWNTELDQVAEAIKPIAEGVHTFRIVSAKPTKAGSGNDMIRLECKVEGGPDNGRMGIVNIVFPFGNPRAVRMTMRRLAAFGITEEMLRAENPSIPQIAAKLIGVSAPGMVTHREWNNEVQNDIDFSTAVTGGGAGIPPAPTVPAPQVQAPATSLDDTTTAAPQPPTTAAPQPNVSAAPAPAPAPVATLDDQLEDDPFQTQ